MKTESMLNKSVLGFASPRGLIKWGKTIKEGLLGPKSIRLHRRVLLLNKGFNPIDAVRWGKSFETDMDSYLSDRDYYKGHPYNGFFNAWIDDKLTTRYVLSNDNSIMPKYYGWYDERGILCTLLDASTPITGTEDVLDLLKNTHSLVLKRLVGTHGLGFYRIEYQKGVITVNGEPTSEANFKEFLKRIRNYIICECVINCASIAKVNPGSLNTVRFNFMNRREADPKLLNCFMRFGTVASGAVDNGRAGGIMVPADPVTGETSMAVQFAKDGSPTFHRVHPDTNEPFPEYIPFFEETIDALSSLLKKYPMLEYVGFDIAFTEDGFKIIEANSLNDLNSVNLHHGVLSDESARVFFQQHRRG